MRVGHAAVEAQGAGGKVGERGEPEATGPRADPFNPAECDWAGALVVAEILEGSLKEEEAVGMMAVSGGQRQPAAPALPAAPAVPEDAMKSMLPKVQWKDKGQTRASAARDRRDRGRQQGRGRGGKRRQGIRGKGQAGTSGTRRTRAQLGGGQKAK